MSPDVGLHVYALPSVELWVVAADPQDALALAAGQVGCAVDQLLDEVVQQVPDHATLALWLDPTVVPVPVEAELVELARRSDEATHRATATAAQWAAARGRSFLAEVR